MPRPGITPEQVFAAASALRDRGQTVTVQPVRQILGTGSFTTLAQHLRAWRAHTEAPPPLVLPPAIAAAATQALTTVWTAALAACRATITERDARIAELKTDLAQAHERHAQKSAECGRLLGVLAAQAPPAGPASSSSAQSA